MNRDEALARIKNGEMDEDLIAMRRAIDARQSDPEYRGRPVDLADRGPVVHCRGMFPHAPHYHQNINSRYNENQWCTGTA